MENQVVTAAFNIKRKAEIEFASYDPSRISRYDKSPKDSRVGDSRRKEKSNLDLLIREVQANMQMHKSAYSQIEELNSFLREIPLKGQIINPVSNLSKLTPAMKFRLFTVAGSTFISGLLIGIGFLMFQSHSANALMLIALSVPGLGTSIASSWALLVGREYDER